MRKHIVCLGDSNTHGYCADPADCADHGDRFNEDERWTCLLQEKLGKAYLVIEEGLSGRTTVFEDALHESMPAVNVVYPILMSHEPVDLLVIMLGTNDTKERFGVNAAAIGVGMQRLIMKCKSVPCWGKHELKILIVAPPHIGDGLYNDEAASGPMGAGCPERSRGLAKYFKQAADLLGCEFMDAEGLAEFNKIDCMHLTAKGHSQLADALAVKIRDIL
ncbi:MAG: hypothetical protein II969_06710 [Anaerolineaceae bacterium]|nr:hypothetical protein [Anaerolineaceae bacterium]